MTHLNRIFIYPIGFALQLDEEERIQDSIHTVQLNRAVEQKLTTVRGQKKPQCDFTRIS